VAPALIIAALFGLLLQQKNRMYLASLWPFFALVASVALVELLRSRTRSVRIAATLLVLSASAEGLLRYRDLFLLARDATSYPRIVARLAAVIPPGANVVAPVEYWMGLHPHLGPPGVFHAIQVPIFLSQKSYTSRPQSFESTVSQMAADTVLLDDSLLDFLDEAANPSHPLAELGAEISDCVTRNGRPVARIEDATYGSYVVYRMDPPRF
jgi:hypothetical protein